VVLKAVSGANTATVKWTGCTAGETLEHECKVAMSAAKTVTATFNLLERPLTVIPKGGGAGTVTSSPAGIECGGKCSASFVKGTTVTLTGTPGAGTLAPSWSGCESIAAEDKCVVTMATAKSVTVTFDLAEYPLAVNTAGAGTGTVTSSPSGIACGATCSASFETGTLVTLTASAEEASTDPVVKWSGCDSVDLGDRCLVAMSAARAVTATFNLAQHQLTVVEAGSGTGTVTSLPGGISCGATCSASYLHGTTVVLTAGPSLHTLPVKWFGCESEPGGNCEVTMSSAREVIAVFDLEPQYVEYNVSVVPKGTGKGTVFSSPGGIECPGDCSESYVFKTPMALFAVPASGSEFVHWAHGTCTGSGPCERKIRSNRTVYAVFKAVGNRTLSVAKAGSGQGVVTSKPAGIECGPTCSTELDASTRVLLRATAAKGSKFKGFTGESCTGAKTCRVTMNEARNVTGTFEKGPASEFATGRLQILSGRARGTKAQLRVSCFGETPCKGTLTLIAKIRNAQGQAKGLVIAKIPYSLAAGASSMLGAKLGSRPLALLRAQGRLHVRVTGGGVEGRSVNLRR
jgi:hypothetical protein